jgi:hypothetical protein
MGVTVQYHNAGADHAISTIEAPDQEIPMKQLILHPTDLEGFNDDAFDIAANGLADSIIGGYSDSIANALADPVVRAVMAADGLEPRAFETLLRTMAAKLDHYRSSGGSLCAR